MAAADKQQVQTVKEQILTYGQTSNLKTTHELAITGRWQPPQASPIRQRMFPPPGVVANEMHKVYEH